MLHISPIDSMRVRASRGLLAADVDGLALNEPLDDATVANIKAAWAEYPVLRFRGQTLDDASLARFSAYLGRLDLAPITVTGKPHLPDFPYVAVVSNVVENGKPLGSLGSYESSWHTDMSYNAEPPSASLLYAIEIPERGGHTSYADMYAAYDTLDEELRRRIAGRSIKHDASTNSAGEIRGGFENVSDPRTAPGAVHPIVRTHPVTGRKALFLGRRLNAYVVDMELAESEALLDELFAHAAREAFVWTQEWRVGDLVMWDNRCVMHRRDAFDADVRRLLHRTQVQGDVPR
ncbi:MAG: TauD/TfdA family dioxygenase [Candidatus Eremiobacteraeota bacterium]|nr:TauD/TfdA family dioxygenase [Candidatus Eremiobacteraeota bacterium]